MNGNEIHHRIPRSLLKLYDICFWSGNDEHWPNSTQETARLARETLEEECARYGIDPYEVSRGMLEMMIKESEIELTWEQHRRQEHAGDWARWGRRGGLKVLELYGRDHFRRLALKRWRKEVST